MEMIANLSFTQGKIAVAGEKPEFDVWGWVIGPFIVWDVAGTGYNVTHKATGYKVSAGLIIEQMRAVVFAARMAEIADWEFTDPATVKAWPADISAQVDALRLWASNSAVEDPRGLVLVPPYEEEFAP